MRQAPPHEVARLKRRARDRRLPARLRAKILRALSRPMGADEAWALVDEVEGHLARRGYALPSFTGGTANAAPQAATNGEGGA